MAIDLAKVRGDFPALEQTVNGNRYVYLDSAATALKPRPVVERLQNFYANEASNVHRGAHFFANLGTRHFENTRESVARFVGAQSTNEIIFTRGTTDSINLVAESFVREYLQPGDEILISDVEHHANIVPWQMAEKKFGVTVKYCVSDENGWIDPQAVASALTAKTKLVALTHASNTLGVVQPMKEIGAIVKDHGAYFLIDGAQYVAFRKLDVSELNCDFYVFSGHKVFGPFGVGVLFGREELLEKMPPYQGGGAMIHQVDLDQGTTYNDLPYKFEAGTPHVAGVIGLGTALDYLQSFDWQELREHESQVLKVAQARLADLGGVVFYGLSEDKVPILSFNFEGIHHSDLGSLVDQMGVAVRVGHHCTQPLMKKLGVTGTVRASFSVFNDEKDIDQLVDAVGRAKEMLL